MGLQELTQLSDYTTTTRVHQGTEILVSPTGSDLSLDAAPTREGYKLGGGGPLQPRAVAGEGPSPWEMGI